MKSLVGLVACLFVSAAVAARAETGFLDRSVTVAGQSYRYQVYVPIEWSREQRWPVVLFLHGAGERGSDGALQTNVGIGAAIRANRARFPAVVVFPQVPRELNWGLSEMEDQALAALDAASKEFSGDPDRTFLVGLSNGGKGALRIASRYASRFAALVDICGPVEPVSTAIPPEQQAADVKAHEFLRRPDIYAALAEAISSVPIQLFHGDADATVPVEQTRRLFAALQKLGADVHYTEYSGVGHNSWDRAFAERDLMPWLLTQRRKVPTK